MAEPRVIGLERVALGVPDVAADTKFYTEIWALAPAATERGAAYLRATGKSHHILSLHPRPAAELLSVDLAAASRADVDALHAKAKGFGVTAIEAPQSLALPGAGYGFAFQDIEGRIFRIVTGTERAGEARDVADRPRKLAHVVLNSRDAHGATRFFLDVLGFKLSDQTRMFDFLRCNADHHTISFAHGAAATLNHIAYDMPNLDSVMRGAGRMRDHGHAIEWGVGRHGPGNNVFAYFVGPNDIPIEYTGEVDQVDDSYKMGKPEDWTWPPGRIDRWGITNPPSKRLLEAMLKTRFAEHIVASAG